MAGTSLDEPGHDGDGPGNTRRQRKADQLTASLRAKRSNPEAPCTGLDCFASLAMTGYTEAICKVRP